MSTEIGTEVARNQRVDDGDDPVDLLCDRRRMRSRPRRFTADVEQVGAFGDERMGVLDSAGGVVAAPAVEERIRRHVDDAAHQNRGTGQACDEFVARTGDG